MRANEIVSVPRVYVVDDDCMIRMLLEASLSAAHYSVETFDCGEALLEVYHPDNPGCLILDVYMPGMDGLELQKHLFAKGNISPVIFLSGSDDLPVAVEAMRGGAVDFLQKPVVMEELLVCVKKAMDQDLRNRYAQLEYLKAQQRVAQLTARELEVMRWIARGSSNKTVARNLDISSRTVEVHRKRVMDKLQAHSVAELVRVAIEIGIT